MVTRSVLKYGGSSVSDFTKIKRIAEMLKERVNQDEQLIVVVSAMGNTTDQLMTNVSTLTKAPKQQELALLLTTGEQQTVSYLSMVLNDIGVNAKAMTGYQAGIKTIGHHLKSKIAQINPQTFEQAFQENDILVVAGFQGINEHQELTTLGRGGSDTTAVALAVSNQIPCEIYTDVAGVALDKHMMHVTISYPLPDNQLLTQLFTELEEGAVNVDMISQIVNLDGLQLSFTIKDSDFHQISMILETLKNQYEALAYKINEHYVKISLIGSGMRDMSGVASKAFLTLIENNIPFYQTTTSEISISYVIDDFNGQQAVEKLYDAFNI
ncbi:aspartate kinase [Staphylococcus aureus]|uniref:aspartate kinase n=1 Tax=Staphylococcus aureus TaxID=1280 RepID=UPI003F5C3E77